MKRDQNHKTEVCVVGAGPIGLMAALHLARINHDVVLIGPLAKADGRTTAIMAEGIDLLKSIDVWNDLVAKATPLRAMRIVDGTRRLVRTPEVQYNASEIGLAAFGYNLKNQDLTAALAKAIANDPSIRWLKTNVATIEPTGEKTEVVTEEGDAILCKMLVGADGQNSIVRQSYNIPVRQWQYDQSAMVMNLSHSRPHNFVSTEFHTEYGPFTFVPLGENMSSLVWVEKPKKAEALLAKSPEELSSIIAEKSHFILGEIEIKTAPKCFPLRGAIAHEFSKEHAVLIGEAAHAFPPIGAQGMNLGIRDLLDLGDLLKRYQTQAGASLVADVCNQYAKRRRTDILSRTGAVDVLNRSLLTDFLPLHLLRGAALYASDKIPVVKSNLMRLGLGLRHESV